MIRMGLIRMFNNTVREIANIAKVFSNHKAIKEEKISESTIIQNYVDIKRKSNRETICISFINSFICYEVGSEGIKVL